MEVPSLTQQEVLERLGITYKSLRRLEARNKIRVVRISRKVVRYYESDVNLVAKRQ